MKVRVKRNIGFRPVSVKISFDNAVEYACFKTMMGASDCPYPNFSIPYRIATGFTGIISTMCGVALSADEVKQCLKGVMKRISNKLPEGGRAGH